MSACHRWKRRWLPSSPDYQLSFRGSMLALDLNTGAIVWKTYTAPAGYTGNAVWGSSPAIDTKRGQVYIATGNNYSVPQSVLDCVTAAGSDPVAQAACLPANDYFDSIMALDLKTGAVRWATRAIPYDAWNVDCIPFFGDGDNCPVPAGPDFDFGQAPALFTVKTGGTGKPRDLVGAGQKSGQYWALDPDTGAVVWDTQAGPGGVGGGLQWGSAVDGQRVYTANANSDLKPWPETGCETPAASGAPWTPRPAQCSGRPGRRTAAAPPVRSPRPMAWCSAARSTPRATCTPSMRRTGQVLWSFPSGGSCLSGAAISNGMVFWGSGYSNFGNGTPNNKLYAFGLP